MNINNALELLREGNTRYVNGNLKHPHADPTWRKSLKEEQHPFAVVLSCADSRVVPELIFDQGLGDLFVIRVAGNVAKDKVVGSIEYAISYLEVVLIVVMGHENCGAVNASLQPQDPGGHFGAIREVIKPAIEEAKKLPGDLLTNSIQCNARLVARDLSNSLPIIAPAVKESRVKIIPAYYELSSGKVNFLD